MKIVKELIPYAIILLVVVLIRSFIATPVIVSGSSMDDTLHDGDILLLSKFDKSYERYDVVVFDYQNTKLVKRIIGLPGEHVKYEDGILYINGEKFIDDFSYKTFDFDLNTLGYNVIPDGYYFVLGDNRTKSSDSRIIGLVNKNVIEGTASFSIWPFGKID